MMAREIIAPPHSAALIEELFSASGTTLMRIEFKPPIDETWQNIVTASLVSGVGTPLAFYANNRVETAPEPSQRYVIGSLYVVSPRPQDCAHQGAKKIVEQLSSA